VLDIHYLTEFSSRLTTFLQSVQKACDWGGDWGARGARFDVDPNLTPVAPPSVPVSDSSTSNAAGCTGKRTTEYLLGELVGTGTCFLCFYQLTVLVWYYLFEKDKRIAICPL